MLDNNTINNIIIQSEIIQALMNKQLSKNLLDQYFALYNFESFEEKIDNIFELMFNNFAAANLTTDTEFLKQVFLMIEDNQEIANACAALITFINTTLNNTMMQLEDKLNQLLEINYEILPQSNVKKCYLYYLLNILLSRPIVDIDFISKITEELKLFLN